ncbi:DEAD/DEAH box helicase [Limnoglobus roseus]|uniref:ATP-dependent helicase n=1 Tax=Limnoglobus roseus TaxID=2598579 RepID=A0A5C1AIN9_9BACT|nr:DEAD/DEAH box helicase [Limnoglobus roseus]QEL16984.1 ATP-dependent helicase [Limnoglobus roseus]
MESDAITPETDLPTSFPTTDEATPTAETIPDLPPEIITPAESAPKVAFADLKLIRPLFDAIEHAGYKFATPVQGAVIPHAMGGRDVIGQAQTGTGKTAAFLIPFLNRWRPHTMKGPIGLIMCPTRELAVQVANEAVKLAPSSRFRTVPVYGGARMGRQLELLAKGCDLVVGTPGRIIDHLRRGSLSLENVRYAVLDEADRMLDIGFRPDIERILRRCPEQRQTLLMSATVPDTIKRLVHRYMKNPIHLNMSPSVLTVDKIQQTYFTVDEDKKFDLLQKVVAREQPRQCLIFVERKRWADRLYRNLKHVVPGVAVIHGDLPQSQREKITAAFRANKVKYLIATDVMSRGIDVEGISHVINYDLPNDIENYVHRIGRTGRIGRDGVAISFVTPEQGGQLTDIEMTINKLIDRATIEGFESHTRRERPDDRVRVLSVDGNATEENASEAPPAPEKKAVYGKGGRRYSSRL